MKNEVEPKHSKMKTISTIILIVFAHVIVTAADTLQSKITQATVFLSGAQVFRETKQVYIPKGVQKMVLKDVSPYMNTNSIQATAKGNFLILDVQHKVRYFEPQKQKPFVLPIRIQREIDRLNDSLIILKYEIERVNQKLVHLAGERNMIMNNKLMNGGGKSDSLPILQEAIKYYRYKLDEIENVIYKERLNQFKLQSLQTQKQIRLNDLRQYNQNIHQPIQQKKAEHDIVITTYAELDVKGRISVNYMVNNAGWIPAYDLRAYDTDQPMQITYKAFVYQNSGEDWNQVDLVLSTYNQNSFTARPELGIWRLDYYVPVADKKEYRSQNFASKPQMQTFVEDAGLALEQIEEEVFVPTAPISETQKSFSNIEFKIKLPYTVPSGGEHILMVVNNHNVDARYFHSLVPKINTNGYVISKISDWEDLNFLPGQANIYFRNTYVGQTSIDPGILQDTMEIAIGKDQQVISTRKKIKDETKNVILGKRIQRSFTFEIMVRNNSSGSIDLKLEDQIPVPGNEDIKVKLQDGGGSVHEELSGKLIWEMVLKPGEVRKIKFSYTVEHDKNRKIN